MLAVYVQRCRFNTIDSHPFPWLMSRVPYKYRESARFLFNRMSLLGISTYLQTINKNLISNSANVFLPESTRCINMLSSKYTITSLSAMYRVRNTYTYEIVFIISECDYCLSLTLPGNIRNNRSVLRFHILQSVQRTETICIV